METAVIIRSRLIFVGFLEDAARISNMFDLLVIVKVSQERVFSASFKFTNRREEGFELLCILLLFRLARHLIVTTTGDVHISKMERNERHRKKAAQRERR